MLPTVNVKLLLGVVSVVVNRVGLEDMIRPWHHATARIDDRFITFAVVLDVGRDEPESAHFHEFPVPAIERIMRCLQGEAIDARRQGNLPQLAGQAKAVRRNGRPLAQQSVASWKESPIKLRTRRIVFAAEEEPISWGFLLSVRHNHGHVQMSVFLPRPVNANFA